MFYEIVNVTAHSIQVERAHGLPHEREKERERERVSESRRREKQLQAQLVNS